MKYLGLLFLVSCSSMPGFKGSNSSSMMTPNHAVITEVDKYISPDKKTEVKILIENMGALSPQSYIGHLKIKPGVNIPTHTHTSDEYLYFIRGAGAVSIDGKLYQVKNGTTVFIPKGVEHSYINNSRTKI